jgi:aspartate aminotransferase-like enzyme
MIPPGLAYLAVSEKAFSRMASTKNPRYYFDLLKERKSAQKGDTSYTPSVALIAGLGAALDYIAGQGGGDLAEGRKKLIENAETCAAMTRAGVEALELFRIAHIGYFDYMDTIAIVGALELVAIETLKLPGVNYGDALAAAQKVFATRRPDEAARMECSCGQKEGHRALAEAALAGHRA